MKQGLKPCVENLQVKVVGLEKIMHMLYVGTKIALHFKVVSYCGLAELRLIERTLGLRHVADC